MNDKQIRWRSLLFVPATSDRFVQSAIKQRADALQIDLEDSIPFADKQQARENVHKISEKFAKAGFDVVVRINRSWRHAVRDLEHSVSRHVKAICLPKVPDAGYVQSIAEVIGELEQENGLEQGAIRLITMVEDARGLSNINEIAAADARVCALIVGAEDLAASLQSAVCPDALYVPNMLAVIACRKAGILPIGFVGSIADFNDEEAFRTKIRQARSMGFEASFCIHPKQVDIVNETFMPDASEIAHARTIMEEYEKHAGLGKGAFTVNGRMVDMPVLLQARNIMDKVRMYNRADCP